MQGIDTTVDMKPKINGHQREHVRGNTAGRNLSFNVDFPIAEIARGQ